MRFTFVTVIYAGDIALHRLQARSMARYLSSDMIAKIIVVLNSPMPDDWHDTMRQHYGPLASYVATLSAEQIAVIPPVAGWYSQQLLKLLVSRHVATDHYVILDAKNHLVFPLDDRHLIKDGKVLSFKQHYERHPLRGYLENAAKYFEIEADLACFAPTTTPFVVPTKSIAQLIGSIQQKEGNFEEFFIRNRMSEFFLFVAYLLVRHQLDDLYDFSGTNYTIIWKDMATHDQWIAREIDKTERRQQPFFSVHRAAYPLLTPCGRQMVADLWHRRDLFGSVSEALQMF